MKKYLHMSKKSSTFVPNLGASAQRAHTYVLISGIYLRRDNLPVGAQKIVGERVLYILKGVY